MSEKYKYDKDSDSLFIYLGEGEEESFEEVVPGINIEMNSSGNIIGVEILKASRFMKDIKKETFHN